MIEIKGNILDQTEADAICVTTNGIVKWNGELVMGAGIALDFAKRHPELPAHFGKLVREKGNIPHLAYSKLANEKLWPYIVISFPTKHDYKDKSDINLIISSAKKLVNIADALQLQKVILPRPGCGLGGLDWLTTVKPAIKDILDDRFYIITPSSVFGVRRGYNKSN